MLVHLLTQGRCVFGQILNNSRHLFALQFLLSYLYLLLSRESDVSYIADWWLVTGAAAHIPSYLHWPAITLLSTVSTISTSVSTQYLQYLHLYLLSIYNIYICIYSVSTISTSVSTISTVSTSVSTHVPKLLLWSSAAGPVEVMVKEEQSPQYRDLASSRPPVTSSLSLNKNLPDILQQISGPHPVDIFYWIIFIYQC